MQQNACKIATVFACFQQKPAKQVYAVSLMAIGVDTEEEKTYMDMLAKRLGLGDASLDEIHAQLGIERR